MKTKKYAKDSMTQTPKKFTTQQLIKALFDVDMLMESCLCPFMLLDETARQCKEESGTIDPHLELNEISVGVREQHMAQSVKEMIRTIKPQAVWLPMNVSYEHGGVPIVIWRLKKDIEMFHRPDKIFFYTVEFFIPNPFRRYWNERDLVI